MHFLKLERYKKIIFFNFVVCFGQLQRYFNSSTEFRIHFNHLIIFLKKTNSPNSKDNLFTEVKQNNELPSSEVFIVSRG